jgi:ATP-dependent DNA helicase RecQ
MHRRFLRLSPADVDLGFAGRYPASHSVHRAIERLAPGDGIELRHGERKWEVWHEGDVVGRLAGTFTPPAEMRCTRATVAAVLTRFAEDSTPEYRGLAKSARWEVVLPELVFEPAAAAVPNDDPWGDGGAAMYGESRVADQ